MLNSPFKFESLPFLIGVEFSIFYLHLEVLQSADERTHYGQKDVPFGVTN